MKPKIYKVTAKLVQFEQYEANWIYIDIPINCIPNVDPGGWGSIPVQATLGSSTWRTSMFPLGKNQPYFLPIKKPVLKKEDLKLGDSITVEYFTTKSSAF